MNIRQVRKKIKSTTNIKKITKAMELVSAIKMKKAQQKAIEGQPYQRVIDTIIKKIVNKIDVSLSPLLNPVESATRQLVIVITSNKGLCGGFNFNIFRFLLDQKVDFSNTDFVAIGKKGSFFINKMKGSILADFSGAVPLNNVSAVFDFVLKNYLEGKYKKISLIYNRFISALKTEPVIETLLPFVLTDMNLVDNGVKQVTTDYLIEPSPNEIIDSLLRSYLEEKIRFAVIQNEAGEHSSRMIAMKNATDNAEDLTYNLTLLRNRLRQQKITYELLDMVTAKESVESV